MGNIQFNNNKILFTANGIAMSPNCCCNPCEDCDGVTPKQITVTISGVTGISCQNWQTVYDEGIPWWYLWISDVTLNMDGVYLLEQCPNADFPHPWYTPCEWGVRGVGSIRYTFMWNQDDTCSGTTYCTVEGDLYILLQHGRSSGGYGDPENWNLVIGTWDLNVTPGTDINGNPSSTIGSGHIFTGNTLAENTGCTVIPDIDNVYKTFGPPYFSNLDGAATFEIGDQT